MYTCVNFLLLILNLCWLIFETLDVLYSKFTHPLFFVLKRFFKCTEVAPMISMCQYYVWVLLALIKFYRVSAKQWIIQTEIKECWYRNVLHMVSTRCLLPIVINTFEISIYQICNLFFKLCCTKEWFEYFFDVNVMLWHHVIMKLLNVLFMQRIYFHSSTKINKSTPFCFEVFYCFLIFHGRLTTIRSC